MAVWHNTSVD